MEELEIDDEFINESQEHQDNAKSESLKQNYLGKKCPFCEYTSKSVYKPLLSTAVTWKQKMSLGNDINISFSLVCGQLKSRIRKNSFEQLLRKSDLKFFPMLI